MACTGCGRGNVREAKLGQCRTCISLNLFGMVVSWGAFGLFSFLFTVPNAARVSLVFSSFFTIFSAAHGVARYRARGEAADRQNP